MQRDHLYFTFSPPSDLGPFGDLEALCGGHCSFFVLILFAFDLWTKIKQSFKYSVNRKLMVTTVAKVEVS